MKEVKIGFEKGYQITALVEEAEGFPEGVKAVLYRRFPDYAIVKEITEKREIEEELKRWGSEKPKLFKIEEELRLLGVEFNNIGGENNK